MNKQLEVFGLSVKYGALTAVSDVSFSVDSNDYFCLAGTNGSGKSSIIKAILGLVPKASGTVLWHLPKEKISYVPQSTAIANDFPASVQEVVLTGAQKSGKRLPFYTKGDRQDVAQAMALFDIDGIASKKIGALSGGQKQRVLLARAMVKKPSFMILDEPCAGLDASSTESFYQLMDALNQKQHLTICIASHDMQGIRQYGKHVLVMDEHVAFNGTAAQWVEWMGPHHFHKGR